jgi:hypothetical protein
VGVLVLALAWIAESAINALLRLAALGYHAVLTFQDGALFPL